MIMEGIAHAPPLATKLQPETNTAVALEGSVLGEPAATGTYHPAAMAISAPLFAALTPRRGRFEQLAVSRQRDILTLRRSP